MDKIFCDYDRAHLYWGDKEKLDAHAVGSEVVVDQIRKKQQTVGRANREGEIGIVSNGVRAVGIAAHVKQQQHNDRHDQSKEHWAAAREVTRFLFHNGGELARETRQSPSGLGFGLFHAHLFARDGFAKTFSCVQPAQTDVEQKTENTSISG